MATKKAKRYEEGGDVESYEDTNAGMKEAYDNRAPLDTSDEDLSRGGKEPTTEAAPKQSFSQAFAAARKSGGKTFEFNGKKYTTDMAGSKPGVKATDSASDIRREARGSVKPNLAPSRGAVTPSKLTAKAAGKAAQDRGVMGGAMANFKKGGKINGIAQRGKTRGKIV